MPAVSTLVWMSCCVMVTNYDCGNSLTTVPVGEAPLAVALGSMMATVGRQAHQRQQRQQRQQQTSQNQEQSFAPRSNRGPVTEDVVMTEGNTSTQASTVAATTTAMPTTTEGRSSEDEGIPAPIGAPPSASPTPTNTTTTAPKPARDPRLPSTLLSRLTSVGPAVPFIPTASFAATVSQLKGKAGVTVVVPAPVAQSSATKNPQRSFSTFMLLISKRLPATEREMVEQLTNSFTSGRIPFNLYIQALHKRLGQAKLGLLLKKFELMSQKMA